ASISRGPPAGGWPARRPPSSRTRNDRLAVSVARRGSRPAEHNNVDVGLPLDLVGLGLQLVGKQPHALGTRKIEAMARDPEAVFGLATEVRGKGHNGGSHAN